MSMKREEASTTGRYCNRLAFGVTVLVCDFPRCRNGFLCGIGEGDDMPEEARIEAEDCGWLVYGDGEDRCPKHADAIEDD